nr:fimbrial protein [uncultured Erwinia sp.]
MITRALIFSAIMFSSGVYATYSPVHRDLHDVEGENGVVHFHGSVLTSPCILASDSQEQDIDMGEVSARLFHQAGDRSQRVIFAIRMKDCLAGAHGFVDDVPGQMTGTNVRTYISDERVISLTFAGEPDVANPDLLMVRGGVRGLGLRLMDSKGNVLPLNQTQRPYLLTPGDNTLSFMASLESTQRYVGAGSYYGMVRLMMEYL